MSFNFIDLTGQSGDNLSPYGGGGTSGMPGMEGNAPAVMPPFSLLNPGSSGFATPSLGAPMSPFSLMGGAGAMSAGGMGGGGDPFGGFGSSMFGGGGGGFGTNPFSLLSSLMGGSGQGGFGSLLGGQGGGLGNLFSGGMGGDPLGLASGFGDMAGSSIANAIGGGGPNFGQGSAAEGEQIGGMIGGIGGSFLGPLGTFGGSALGSLLGGLIAGYMGGGLPKMAKPQAAVGALEGSGNWVEQMLGKYMSGSGIGHGYDFSESGAHPGFNPQSYSNMLQLLSGIGIPSHGGVLNLGNLGFQNPVSLYGFKNLSELQSQFPDFKPKDQLAPGQIEGILPELRMLAGHGSLKKEYPQFSALAKQIKQAETY